MDPVSHRLPSVHDDSKGKRRRKSAHKTVASASRTGHTVPNEGMKHKTDFPSASGLKKRKKRDLDSKRLGSAGDTRTPASRSKEDTLASIDSPKPKRIKHLPLRFSHPQLQTELRRLRRPWLSPGDPLFAAVHARSYKGLRHLPAETLPSTIHARFRRAFDSLHEAGLFLYDTVQAGGKRLSRTFVTRTLIGDPGITYKVSPESVHTSEKRVSRA